MSSVRLAGDKSSEWRARIEMKNGKNELLDGLDSSELELQENRQQKNH